MGETPVRAPGLQRAGHPQQTALRLNPPLGYATVTHPFHPLRGKRFLVLKSKKCARHEILSLFDEPRGVFGLPRDWTDLAPPSAINASLDSPVILDARCLLALSQLVEILKPGVDDAK